MSREILFRAIDEVTQEWVYGYYYESQKPSDFGGERRYYIFDDKTISKYNVIPETVGQFTGLTDKNGKKIFEGDIVRVVFTERRNYLGVDYDEDREYVEQIIFEYGAFILKMTYDCIDFCRPLYEKVNSVGVKLTSLEVIGNIHDNPELLENRE